MASSKKIAELVARLRNLADGISTDGNDDPREKSRNALRKAAVDLEQDIVKSHPHDDSYVLVLIDAHSHPFNKEIFYRSTDQSYPALDREQPLNAKKRLYEAVRTHLIRLSPTIPLGTSRIVVRIYANTIKLENDLLYPLQQFAVQFSSLDSDFDFFSVGDEAMVELKVVDALEAARKDGDCKHVFLAAWRRPVYISMLQTPSRNITLIQGHGMGAGAKFVPLPCDMLSISEIFSKPEEEDVFLSIPSFATGNHIMAILVLKAFRYSVKRTPCARGSDCPLIDCIYGHVCQETNCLKDDPKPCRMRRFHGVDLAFASWVKGKHAPEFPTGGPVQVPGEYAEEVPAESFWF
ncbi:hypothetical protein G6011_05816 [Alternaria panax]|uniref:Uncharacterized protein n=1 Tax=Alternaria panax TaxID=48097 RepID=A0AAD4FFC4_9PLEO|nr:hypothetical protein G6011_05816 [Alternaria panax]